MKSTNPFLLVVTVFIFPFLCQGLDVPLTSSTISVDFNGAHYYDNAKLTMLAGAEVRDNDIKLTMMEGSKLSYTKAGVTKGIVQFNDGIKFSENGGLNRALTFTNFTVDVKTGIITAKVTPSVIVPNSMGGTLPIRLGTIDMSKVEASKDDNTTELSLYVAANLVPDPAFISALVLTFGLPRPQNGKPILTRFVFNVDLALGSNINADLAEALDLKNEIDVNQSVGALKEIKIKKYIRWK